MGLRSLLCLLPKADAPDHGDDEQPGTSYEGTPNFASYRENCRNRTRAEGREKVNCSSGSAHLFACFRAGTINLIVHPACELACQRQGASTVQPVNSLPRTNFLDNAEDHDSGDDDPTSPKVTCIGQVRKEKTPSKTPTRTTTAEIPHRRDLKLNRRELQNSSRGCKWKHILGTRGTVNRSQQQQQQQQLCEMTAEESTEFDINLNRFGSAASSISAQTTPTFGNPMNFSIPSTLAETLTTATQTGNNAAPKAEPDAALLRALPGASEGVLLWKRRSGACQPMSLDLKRRGLQSVT